MKPAQKSKLLVALGLGLIAVSGGPVAIEFVKSSHTERHDGTNGGFYFVHTAAVSNVYLVPAGVGIISVAASFLVRRT